MWRPAQLLDEGEPGQGGHWVVDELAANRILAGSVLSGT